MNPDAFDALHQPRVIPSQQRQQTYKSKVREKFLAQRHSSSALTQRQSASTLAHLQRISSGRQKCVPSTASSRDDGRLTKSCTALKDISFSTAVNSAKRPRRYAIEEEDFLVVEESSTESGLATSVGSGSTTSGGGSVDVDNRLEAIESESRRENSGPKQSELAQSSSASHHPVPPPPLPLNPPPPLPLNPPPPLPLNPAAAARRRVVPRLGVTSLKLGRRRTLDENALRDLERRRSEEEVRSTVVDERVRSSKEEEEGRRTPPPPPRESLQGGENIERLVVDRTNCTTKEMITNVEKVGGATDASNWRSSSDVSPPRGGRPCKDLRTTPRWIPSSSSSQRPPVEKVPSNKDVPPPPPPRQLAEEIKDSNGGWPRLDADAPRRRRQKDPLYETPPRHPRDRRRRLESPSKSSSSSNLSPLLKAVSSPSIFDDVCCEDAATAAAIVSADPRGGGGDIRTSSSAWTLAATSTPPRRQFSSLGFHEDVDEAAHVGGGGVDNGFKKFVDEKNLASRRRVGKSPLAVLKRRLSIVPRSLKESIVMPPSPSAFFKSRQQQQSEKQQEQQRRKQQQQLQQLRLGRLLYVNALGLRVLKLERPLDGGPYGFYVAKGLRRELVISKLSDQRPAEFFDGLLGVGDEIKGVDDEFVTTEWTLDDAFEAMTRRDSVILTTLPFDRKKGDDEIILI